MANGENSPQESQDPNSWQTSNLLDVMLSMLADMELTNANSPGEPVIKEWHHSVSTGLRNHLIEKLVKSIYPNDNLDMQDEKIANLVAFAEEVEADAYETANTRSEYYHLLAEKIFKVQKELAMKEHQQVHL